MRRFTKGSYSHSAFDYAKKVVAGKIPACIQVRQQCQRTLDDLSRDDLIYDEAAADHACSFISALPHVIGTLSGEPIKLEPFQLFILCSLFGFLAKRTKLRKYREAFILLPRGNAKSTLAAGIALLMTFALGQGGAEGLSGATSINQAKAVWLPAKHMCEMTPALTDALGIETSATSIYQVGTRSSFQCVKAMTRDGGLPWIGICDELHQAINAVQIEAFRKGMGKRRGADPMLLIISTAGVNLGGICRQEQLYFEAVLNGTIKDDAKFALIYTIDKEDSWRDFSVWRKANPNYGVSVDEDHLRGEYEKALQSPAAQADCLTKYLNVWQSSNSAWLNQKDWAEAAERIDWQALKGRPAGIGVDLSTLMDLTSVSAVVELEDGRKAIIPFSWVAGNSLARTKNETAYAQWIDKGDLIASDGTAIDLQAIEDKIRELCSHFRVSGVYFDPKDAAQMQQNLLNEGLPVVTFGQNAMNYTPVMAAFEADLASGKIVHPDNEVLNWCAFNLSIRRDRNDNMHPQKPDRQDHLRIDTMIATLMGFAAASVEPPPPPPAFAIYTLD